ncbi:MAG: hypothetical protein P4L16_04655 [Chlamydiales bacterium]|nr:hypothetical protein [Chlamydiales bacterium]
MYYSVDGALRLGTFSKNLYEGIGCLGKFARTCGNTRSRWHYIWLYPANAIMNVAATPFLELMALINIVAGAIFYAHALSADSAPYKSSRTVTFLENASAEVLSDKDGWHQSALLNLKEGLWYGMLGIPALMLRVIYPQLSY